MICVSISKGSVPEIKSILDQVELAELRLDMLRLEPKDVEKLFDTPVWIIATCRQTDDMKPEKRKLLLEAAINSGVDMVDIDIDSIGSEAGGKEVFQMVDKLKDEAGFTLIVSYHNYEHTPGEEELNQIVQACFAAGAHIAKISCQVNKPLDNLRLLKLLDRPGRVVVSGMGELGKVTRVAALELGAPFTYASWKKEEETAPGQLTIDEMKKVQGLMRGTSKIGCLSPGTMTL